MARLFRFFNIDSASEVYLEFIADEPLEAFPSPTTKDTFKI